MAREAVNPGEWPYRPTAVERPTQAQLLGWLEQHKLQREHLEVREAHAGESLTVRTMHPGYTIVQCDGCREWFIRGRKADARTCGTCY